MNKKIGALILSAGLLACLGLSFTSAAAATQTVPAPGYSGGGIVLDIDSPSHGVITVHEGGPSGRALADGATIASGTVVWVRASADREWSVDGITIAGRFMRGDTASALLMGDGVCKIYASIYRDRWYDDDDDDDDDKTYSSYGRERDNAARGIVSAATPSETLARTATKAAIKKAGGGQAKVLFRDARSLSQGVLRAVDKQAGGHDVMVCADTMRRGAIQARLYLDPARAGDYPATIRPGIQTDSATCRSVQSLFKRTKGVKNLAVVRFDQQGSFGVAVSVAVKADLSGFDKAALRFYLYDEGTNSYTEVALDHSIDSNDYLHFSIEDGKTLIVTDQAL